jgi:hypothetical protein
MGASNAENNRRELPTKSALGEAGEIKIQDKDGKEIALKSLYTEKPANERQLLIFIRHFFCGVSPCLFTRDGTGIVAGCFPPRFCACNAAGGT